jgi:phosphatidylinositol-bisphosphatase
VFGVPQDLRVAHKPLHTRLSAAFAGEAGDDFTDIVRIRDEWIRTRVRETSSKGKQNLRCVPILFLSRQYDLILQHTVRIGMFNVNGNLPSQDLSPWVGGNGNGNITDPFIPPLKEISPFSIGEVAKNPFDTPGELSATNECISCTETFPSQHPHLSPMNLNLNPKPHPRLRALFWGRRAPWTPTQTLAWTCSC